MVIARQDFVGNPNKQEYFDEDEIEYYGDDVDFNPFGLPPGDPDLMLDDNYDIIDDDEEYEPEEDMDDYLTDTEYEEEASEESSSDHVSIFVVNFSDSNDEESPVASDNNQESTNKCSTDNKSAENKVNGEVKTPGAGDVSTNEADANT